mmetsp:Transcript_3735/g.7243  ORF Transcript_3735/g.7243 Transcript_3735/m.7243 type:complete len:503 (+) Transcript_3735:319-1827(+)
METTEAPSVELYLSSPSASGASEGEESELEGERSITFIVEEVAKPRRRSRSMNQPQHKMATKARATSTSAPGQPKEKKSKFKKVKEKQKKRKRVAAESKNDEEEEEEEEEVIIVEADYDFSEEDLRRRVLEHLNKQETSHSNDSSEKRKKYHKHKHKTREIDIFMDEQEVLEELRIQWDEEWRTLNKFIWGTIGFIFPPLLVIPLRFLFRVLVVWPVLFAWRMVLFLKDVAVQSWPIIVGAVHSIVRFPHRLVYRVLYLSEAFAYRTIDRLRYLRASILYSLLHFHNTTIWVGEVAVGAIIGTYQSLKERLTRVGFCSWQAGAFLSWFTYTNALYVIYLVLLPFRVGSSVAKAFFASSSVTFASFQNLPSKIAHFVAHSPNIFGRSGKRLVRFMRRNRQDLIDVLVAFMFLAILSMIITGVFWPLLTNGIRVFVELAWKARLALSRLRIPKLRIPRLNVAKFKEVFPWLPVPSLPKPDIALLLGLRERTLFEKVVAFLQGTP